MNFSNSDAIPIPHLVHLGLIDHLLDLLLAEPALLIRDRDLVLLPRGLVHRRHVENPVGVHVESDLYLGHTAGGRRNPTQVEFAQQMVVLGHRPLALVHLLKKKCLNVVVSAPDCQGSGLEEKIKNNRKNVRKLVPNNC